VALIFCKPVICYLTGMLLQFKVNCVDFSRQPFAMSIDDF